MRNQISEHWASRYVGFPWALHGRDERGFDCWGLVRHVYVHELGIELPCFAGAYSDPAEIAETQALRAGDPELSLWRNVPLSELQPFDVIMFAGAHLHVGLAIDARRMLHADRGRLSEIIKLGGLRGRLSCATATRRRTPGDPQS